MSVSDSSTYRYNQFTFPSDSFISTGHIGDYADNVSPELEWVTISNGAWGIDFPTAKENLQVLEGWDPDTND